MERKQTKGRQKVELKKIEKEESLHSTFSKRKSGIYKQANELVTSCGAEVGALIFSPAGKVFSYAVPSVESVTNRVMNMNQNPPQALMGCPGKVMNELHTKNNEMVVQLSADKERAKQLEQMTKMQSHGQAWWETSLVELDYEEPRKRDAIFLSLHSAALDMPKGKTSAASSSAAANFTDTMDTGRSGKAIHPLNCFCVSHIY
ncbi:hypothetical protein L6164_000077 [Bauhinia variegata]|uniref:Uncharacterized protein n=1 Tax=Bauhinia variegata TaxID=167791 RepID=A0ACB9Q5E5_BAUVA|nr:hypothetical protein L6164_000077 [Bauhinia variegata]